MATLNYGSRVPALPDWADEMLRGFMDEAGVASARVNSTVRSIESQVSAMYDNERNGKRIRYGKVGRQVVDLIQQMGFNVPKAGVVEAGVAVARDLVAKGAIFSYHVEGGFPDGYAAADLQPDSIDRSRYLAFIDVLTKAKSAGKLKELILPPEDPAVHVVLVRDKSRQAVAAVQNLATGGDAASYEGEDDEAVPYMATGTFLLLVGAGVGGWFWWSRRRVRRNPSLPSGSSRALRLRRSKR